LDSTFECVRKFSIVDHTVNARCEEGASDIFYDNVIKGLKICRR